MADRAQKPSFDDRTLFQHLQPHIEHLEGAVSAIPAAFESLRAYYETGQRFENNEDGWLVLAVQEQIEHSIHDLCDGLRILNNCIHIDRKPDQKAH